jgi:acetoin utilization protein AcuB
MLDFAAPRQRLRWRTTCFGAGMTMKASPASNRSPAAPELVIKDAMTPQPHTIGRDQPLAVAHRMMRDHRIRHLPVLEHGRLVGIISQRDLYFLETIAGIDLDKDCVEDGMNSDTFVVGPNESIVTVAAEMYDRKLGSAVVIDHDRVVGIFTASDALRLLSGRPRTPHS